MQGVLEKRAQAVRAFVIYERVGGIFVGGEEASSLSGLARWIASEGETVDGEACKYDGHNECGGAGNHSHFYCCLDCVANQGEAGVGDGGRAAVCYEGDGFAVLEQGDNSAACPLLVVLVEGDLRFFGDVEMFEEQACFSGVF